VNSAQSTAWMDISKPPTTWVDVDDSETPDWTEIIH
jgi:hypothetical protein